MDILTGSHEQSVMTVTLSGRLDALEAAALRNVLDQAMSDGLVNLAIDLSDVDFVDSAGLAALVKGMKDARTVGGDVKLVSPESADAMRVFELTKFDQVFTMVSDIEDILRNW